MDEHMQTAPVDIHEPFTKEELLDQLANIDQDITKLLTHAGTAIQALSPPAAQQPDGTTPPPPVGPDGAGAGTIANLNGPERVASFKQSMNAFISTLHSVDVRLKRQIWALEEAGVITLGRARDGGGDASAAAGESGGGAGGAAGTAVETNLAPDGEGKIGGLNVGWLNARSNKVERDKEAEMWTGLRKLLEAELGERIAARDGGGQQGHGGDVAMQD